MPIIDNIEYLITETNKINITFNYKKFAMFNGFRSLSTLVKERHDELA